MVKKIGELSSNQNGSLENKEKIQSYGYASFIFLLVNSTLMGLNSFMVYSLAGADAYISCIVGTLIGFIVLGIFLYIKNKNPEKNIIYLNQKLYGKVIGTTINMLLNAIVLIFMAVVMYNITFFLVTQYLPETQSLYVSLLIVIAILYTVTKGIVVMSKANQIFMFMKIGLFVVAAISLLQYHEIDNLYPILTNGWKNPILGSLIYVIFTISPVFFLTIIDREKIEEEKGSTKKIIVFYFLANLVITLIFFITTLVFGIEFISIYRYPEYMVLKKIKLFSSIGRIENILALQFLMDSFVCLALGVYFCVHSAKTYFKKANTNIVATIICISILIISNFIFTEPQQVQAFLKQYFLSILGVGFLGIMILTFMILLTKNIIGKVKRISEKIES